MTASTAPLRDHGELLERVDRLERQLESLSRRLPDSLKALQGLASTSQGEQERLSIVVFSGELDRLLAALIIATGAAASQMEVELFFTFWGTTALRKPGSRVQKSWFERMLSWCLPQGTDKLRLSNLNLAGTGPAMLRYVMRSKGVASADELLGVAAELGVGIKICTMSMDLLGMKEGEFVDYPGLGYCGVTHFVERAASGKVTLFI